MVFANIFFKSAPFATVVNAGLSIVLALVMSTIAFADNHDAPQLPNMPEISLPELTVPMLNPLPEITGGGQNGSGLCWEEFENSDTITGMWSLCSEVLNTKKLKEGAPHLSLENMMDASADGAAAKSLVPVTPNPENLETTPNKEQPLDERSIYAKVALTAKSNGADPFFQCLTYDRTVWSQKLGIPKADLNAFLDRKDKAFPPKDPAIAATFEKMTKNDTNGVKFPFRDSFQCPNLTNGHALESEKVCHIYTGQKTALVQTLDNGGTYCLFEAGSSGVAVLPNVVCQRFGQNELGLDLSKTSIFVRWYGPSHEAVCFFLKLQDIEDGSINFDGAIANAPSTVTPDLNSCAWFIALMKNADYWREQAGDLLDEVAMEQYVMREWRAISLSARQGADYVRKSGAGSNQSSWVKKATELEQRVGEYVAKTKSKVREAEILLDKASAEDLASMEHLKKWCKIYEMSPQTAFEAELVNIGFNFSSPDDTPPANSDHGDEEYEDGEYIEQSNMYLDLETYTPSDIQRFLQRWLSSQFHNDPVIVGAGNGLGRDMMVLAQLRPDLALRFLNKLSNLESDDLESVLELVKLVREEIREAETSSNEQTKRRQNHFKNTLMIIGWRNWPGRSIECRKRSRGK